MFAKRFAAEGTRFISDKTVQFNVIATKRVLNYTKQKVNTANKNLAENMQTD